MAKLKWIRSYGTLKFDTPDGDLDKGDYAVHPSGGFCVRLHPKNNFMHSKVDELDPDVHKKEVAILDGEVAYYHEFEMEDGRLYREQTTEADYNTKCKSKDVVPEKEMSKEEQDVEKLKQDDFEKDKVDKNVVLSSDVSELNP